VGTLTLIAALFGMLLTRRAIMAASITAAVLLVSLVAEFVRIHRRHGTP